MAHQSARAIAFAALREWRRGDRFGDAILQALLSGSALAGSDRAFATELFYGVLRNLTLLDFWIALLRSGSIDDESRDLLRLGLYQMFCLRTPSHAAVFETVELASRRSRSFVNAMLRSALRRAEELQQAADAAPLTSRTSHPGFLIERWTRTFGADATSALCEWDNQSAPVYARVNTLRTSPAEFLAHHPESEPLPSHPLFVRLTSIPAEALGRGDCYIQDPSTSAAVELLGPQPGQTVLDACAAPGGKSGFMAALMQNRGELVACDRDPARVEKLAGNLERLGVQIARVAQHDWAAQPLAEELAPRSFDRILLDAPCTNTGVLRRRVDARWRLQPNDFKRMPEEQLTILRRLVPLLKPGGALVYSTCSIEPEENEQVVSRAMAEFPFLRQDGERSVLPFRDGYDGAFAARLLHAG
ncbi:MAG: 16S rRNA (cytosine(967)-C(5))-methyltransferase [uncultured Chthoniobacterales bacterium]|uniref:16S rRNA (cytosine(967)-C(5))-methyltransferase n=1 Tax=uncultured Chthoniobacterales bacterium TaxID=1836801 RepID=A0A6J4IUX9_9BACT|nr:MAG: 16S rRNA (cytosine(967)-C(5))-methyltransferase [uncultured Chthoniobacterales bacterium]